MTTNPDLQEVQGVRLAIEGCGHGTLHAIYASVEESCKQKGWPGVDLLIIGGDFQAVRNAYDLNCVSMPPKYRAMGDFHEYYSGHRAAPYLTVFVGGNHEASNYLLELYYGGWAAPNIYYLGAANVLRLGPLRIAGLSGIWKGFDYRKPHFERQPFNGPNLKSIYHVRELDVRKLLQVGTQVDVGISHDWPQGVEWKGDWEYLFKIKRHFERDARSGALGSVAAKQVLDRLRPKFWFSAHLHCKYAAIVDHQNRSATQAGPSQTHDAFESKKNEDEIDLDDGINDGAEATKNTDEIDLDLDGDDNVQPSAQGSQVTNSVGIKNLDGKKAEIDDKDEDRKVSQGTAHGGSMDDSQDNTNAECSLDAARAALPASFQRRPPPEIMEHPPEITNPTTNFLALDKCLPNRNFLQLMEVPTDPPFHDRRPVKLEYDREWLAITRAFSLTEPPIFGNPDARVPPTKTQAEYCTLIEEQRQWVDENIKDSDLVVPENFEITAPVYDGGDWRLRKYLQTRTGGAGEYRNPQIEKFCQLLDFPNPLVLSDEELSARMNAGPPPEFDDRDAGRLPNGRVDYSRRGNHRWRGGRGRGG